MVVAVLLALDKTDNKVVSKIVEAVLIITVICSFVHIAQCTTSDYFTAIKDAYNVYKIDGSMLGGGVLGAAIGGIIMLITGGNKVAAFVIVTIVLFSTQK